MNAPQAVSTGLIDQLARLRGLLQLVDRVGELAAGPIEPEPLQRAIDAALDLALKCGANEANVERLRAALSDRALLEVACRLIDFVRLRLLPAAATPTAPRVAVHAAALVDWLPLLIELLSLLNRCREPRKA